MKAELQTRLEALMSRFASPYGLELQTVIDNQQHCLQKFTEALGALREKMEHKLSPDEEFLPEEEKTDTRLTKAEFTQWLSKLNLVQLHLLRVFLWETFNTTLHELIHIHSMLGGLHALLVDLNAKDPEAVEVLSVEVSAALKQIEEVSGKRTTGEFTIDDSPFVIDCDQSQVLSLLEAEVAAQPALTVNQLLYVNSLSAAVRKMVAAIDQLATGHLRVGHAMVAMAGQIGAKLEKAEGDETFVPEEQREKVAELQHSLEIMGRALMAKFSAEFLFKCSKADLLVLYSRLKVSELVVERIKEMTKGAVVLPKSDDISNGLKATGMALADIGVHKLPVPTKEEVNTAARAILKAMHYPVENDGEGDYGSHE